MVGLKKRFLLTGFFLLVVAVVSGCGGGAGQKAQEQPGQAPSFSLTTPPEAQQLWTKGEEAYAAGKAPAAISQWDRIIQKYPDTAIAAKAMNRVGEVYLAQGQPERALQYFDYLIYSYPRWDGLGMAKVNRLKALAQTPKRKQVAKEALPLYDSLADNPEARFQLASLMAWVFGAENDLDAAFDWSAAGFGLARSPEEKRELTKTTSEFLKNADEGTIRKLYKKNPSDFMKVFLDLRLARIEGQKGQGDAVRERLRELLARNTMHPLAPEIQAELRGTRAEAAIPLKADRVGVLVPLNGPNAKYGDMVVRGLTVASSEWSEKNPGQKVTLVVKDASPEGQIAEKSFEDLAQKEGVLGVIGPLGSQATKAVAPLANREGIPLLTLTQKEDEIRDNSFVLHVFIDSREMVRALVKHCREKLGISRFAALYPDDSYGQRLSKVFAEVVQEQGGSILASVSYKERSSDFKEPIQKLLAIAKKNVSQATIEAAPFEALFIPDQVQAISLIAPQLPYNNVVGVTLLGTNLWSEGPLVQSGGAYVEQAVFAASFFPESQSGLVRAFREKFEAAFSATPSYLEAQAYDALMMLLQARSAASASGPADRVTVLQKLLQTRNFKGVAGTYSITPSGDFELRYIVLQVLNGQVTQVSQ